MLAASALLRPQLSDRQSAWHTEPGRPRRHPSGMLAARAHEKKSDNVRAGMIRARVCEPGVELLRRIEHPFLGFKDSLPVVETTPGVPRGVPGLPRARPTGAVRQARAPAEHPAPP